MCIRAFPFIHCLYVYYIQAAKESEIVISKCLPFLFPCDCFIIEINAHNGRMLQSMALNQGWTLVKSVYQKTIFLFLNQ